MKLGELKKAEKVFLKALKIKINHYGENHQDLAGDYANLGSVYLE